MTNWLLNLWRAIAEFAGDLSAEWSASNTAKTLEYMRDEKQVVRNKLAHLRKYDLYLDREIAVLETELMQGERS